MRSCPKCEGFVPSDLRACPHCERALAPARGLSLRAKIGSGLLAGSAAMTLMACYGAPCGADECLGPGPGETCDPEAMPEQLESSALPLMIEGTLIAQEGLERGGCGGSGDELVYAWTPPAAGSYRLSVQSSIDTVLYVREPDEALGGSCGEQLACNDDTPAGENPELELSLASTDPVFVVVDAFSVDSGGSFTLSIEEL